MPILIYAIAVICTCLVASMNSYFFRAFLPRSLPKAGNAIIGAVTTYISAQIAIYFGLAAFFETGHALLPPQEYATLMEAFALGFILFVPVLFLAGLTFAGIYYRKSDKDRAVLPDEKRKKIILIACGYFGLVIAAFIASSTAGQMAALFPKRPSPVEVAKEIKKAWEDDIAKAVREGKLPPELAIMQQTLKTEPYDALAMTLSTSAAQDNPSETMIKFSAQNTIYFLQIPNAKMNGCKLSAEKTFFTIKRSALFNVSVLKPSTAKELYVYDTDTSKPPTLCVLDPAPTAQPPIN